MNKQIFAILVAFLVESASATPIVFFGEDLSTALGNDVPRLTSRPNALAAASDFSSRINGAFFEDFESFAAGTPTPLVIDFGGAGLATIDQGDQIIELTDPTDTLNGTFPTSGDKFLLAFAGANSSATFTLTFDQPQSAFGFFGTDFEDSESFLLFTHVVGPETTLTIPHTQQGVSGSVLFLGIIDLDNPFTSVRFQTTNVEEGLGFDDFVIATANQVSIPIPSTIYLILFGGAALFMRRTLGEQS